MPQAACVSWPLGSRRQRPVLPGPVRVAVPLTIPALDTMVKLAVQVRTDAGVTEVPLTAWGPIVSVPCSINVPG